MAAPAFSEDVALIREGAREVPVREILSGVFRSELRDLSQYALHSMNIYEPRGEYDDDCLAEGKRFELRGWHEIENCEEPGRPRFHYVTKGLQYEVWWKDRPGRPKLAAIVFRGTDRREFGDWISNFRWITRFVPLVWDQYDQTRSTIPAIVSRIHDLLGRDTEIVTTGHSLGGGLAQQAGYASEHIRAVYAFNPSAVTGFYSLPRALRNRSKVGMQVFRSYERGEVLAYLRTVMKSIYPVSNKDPKIVELRFDLIGSKGMIRKHSMKQLAGRLHAYAQN